MFDAIITTSDDPFELAETLAALVPAVVNGALRRVIIVAERQPSHATMRLIEESGADLLIAPGDVFARWQSALQQKAGGWTVCLAAGIVPVGDWVEAVIRFTARAAERDAASFQVGGSWRVRASARLLGLIGRRAIAAGQIVYGPAAAGRMTTLNATVDDRRAGAGVPLLIPV